LDFCGAHTENFFIYQSPKTTWTQRHQI
jgi:hypothetical protein